MKDIFPKKNLLQVWMFVFLVAFVLNGTGGCKKNQHKPLDILTPPLMNSMVSELGTMFEKNYGISVNVKSVDLFQVDDQTKDDILFCYDSQKQKDLSDHGCVAKAFSISYTTPVIVLPGDNPHRITNVRDAALQGLNIAVQEPSKSLLQYASSYFSDCEKWPQISPETSLVRELEKPECDAILTWKFIADVYGDDQVTIIPLLDRQEETVNINVLVLTPCKDITTYNAFLSTLTSKSGQDILKKHNFATVIH